MLRPSYTELMDIMNNEQAMDNKITSRYSIVIAAAKRARQLIDGAQALAAADSDKAVSVAVNEIYEGRIKINATTNTGGIMMMDEISER
jgi:DNA-directed RNA polymerase subunit omega